MITLSEVMWMNQFRKFMYGRYGPDQYSRFLIGIALVLSIIGSISRFGLVIYISYFVLLYAVYRILSKNVSKRTQENYKYIKIINTLKSIIYKKKRIMNGTTTHKFYKCPKCKQTIRVPKGKGKICITCPKCNSEFMKRT